jgi:hypothetical protein
MSWQADFRHDTESRFIDAYEQEMGRDDAFYELPEQVRDALLTAVHVIAPPPDCA